MSDSTQSVVALAELVTGDWRSVTLAELDRRAALLDRQEAKYVMPIADLAAMRRELSAGFDVLTIDGRRVFGYDTIYFDTADLLSYRQHAQGKRLRFKARSRCYLDSDLCFAEIKLKGARDRTVKHRMAIEPADHGRAGGAMTEFFATCISDAYPAATVPELRPALGMRFERITLVGTAAPERVTIDHRLRFATSAGAAAAASDAVVIVEVKSPNGRGVADRIVRTGGRRGEPCSKYCIGLNMVTPGLRGNAFKRSLKRHFAPA